VPKILQIFRRNKNQKIRRKAVYSAFKKVLVAEVIQFPRQREKPRKREYAGPAEELPDYETITRWLKLADELLGDPDPDSDDYQNIADRKKA
jgi:hypothetical protein